MLLLDHGSYIGLLATAMLAMARTAARRQNVFSPSVTIIWINSPLISKYS
jgi:hypothetical protein